MSVWRFENRTSELRSNNAANSAATWDFIELLFSLLLSLSLLLAVFFSAIPFICTLARSILQISFATSNSSALYFCKTVPKRNPAFLLPPDCHRCLLACNQTQFSSDCFPVFSALICRKFGLARNNECGENFKTIQNQLFKAQILLYVPSALTQKKILQFVHALNLQVSC